GNAKVYDNAWVFGNAKVYDNAWVFGNAKVYGNAFVSDNAPVCGDALVCGDAFIISKQDYIVFKNWWSSGRYFTWTRSNNKWKVGCFYGTGDELIAKAYKDSELSGREYERVVKYVESIINEDKI
ncbi:MAG: polymer-forming cytoskeletal protein, partial [Candidatus Coprovivens sp.]